MNGYRTLILFIMLSFGIFPAFAQEKPVDSVTEVIPIDFNIGIEKTTLSFNVPSNNKLPWAFVEGNIANSVPGYDAIIQIYDLQGKPIHFAQTKVTSDGNYEYKFRVYDVTDGKTIKTFEGDYIVKIFKVVYLDNFSA